MPKVLSVGQCGVDHSAIARELRNGFGAEVVAADSSAEAVRKLNDRGIDLVLVNRVFDRDGSPGVELIRALKSDPAHSSVPVILVSNYADAQAEAEGLRALPGFGKAELGGAKARERLKSVLSQAPAQS